MTSYRRISGRTLNREVNNNGNIDIYMNPIGRGIYPSVDPNAPVNGIITGNLSVSGNSSLTGTLGVGGNTVINGNLTVNGTTHIIDSSNTSFFDALIELNRGVIGANTNDSGIIIDRGTSGDNAFMGWKESVDTFIFGTTTSDASSNGAITGFVPKNIYAHTAALDTSGSLIFTTGTFSTNIQVTEPTTSDKTITFPNATGTVSLLTNTETLTNKTLTLPKINDLTSTNTYDIVTTELAANRTITLPLLTGNDTFVFVDHIQTLTNKSLTNPDIDGGTIDSTQIGTTTPDSGAFTTLSATTLTVTGSTTFSGTTTFTSLDLSGGNITNVGSIACDSIVVDNAAVGLNITYGGVTMTNKITLTDNLADALNITEGANSYIKFTTTDAAEQIVFGKNTTFSGTTIASLGTVTTADINGGTLDGVVIGGAAAAAGTFTAVAVTNTATTTNAVSISANALTTGSALDITSNSAGKTTGGLVNIAQTGATTTQTAPSLTVSTTASTNVGAGVASFTGNTLTAGNAVSISANALTSGNALYISATNIIDASGSALKITAAASKMALNVDAGVSRFNGGSITQATTIFTAGGSRVITAAELINGFAYVGSGAGGTLDLSGAVAVQSALNDMGIISAAGTRLTPILVSNTTVSVLTVTGGGGVAIIGTDTINNTTAIIHYIFTGATTAVAIIQQ